MRKEDLTDLCGQKLQQVRFGLYQIQLYFDKDTLIEICDELFYIKNEKKTKWTYSAGNEMFSLCEILEKIVLSISFKGDNIMIVFDNSDSLELLISGEYESVIITFSDRFYVF